MIRPRFGTRAQPVQIPLNRVRPLGQLPLLPLAIYPDHFRLPECFGRIATGRQLVAQPEILEPFQQHQKSRPLRATWNARSVVFFHVISALAAPPETAPPDPTDIRTRPKKNPCLSKDSSKSPKELLPDITPRGATNYTVRQK